MNQIRKITIGVDYKDSMSYSIGQEVYGGHIINEIIETEDKYIVHILKDGYSKEWKTFNKNMGISCENDLNY